MLDLILKSLWETLAMVGVSSVLSVVFGLPLAILLVISSPEGIWAHPWVSRLSGFVVNAIRSIPYIILMVLLMPVTRFLVGTSIGTWAAVVPLTLAGILLMARMMEDNLRSVSPGLMEVGLAAGATTFQIIRSILLKEAIPGLVSSTTTVIINLIGFSAMAGAVGGGGLGDLAIRYGYQRYDLTLMMVVVVILGALVQITQMIGDASAKALRR
jgi:D-methionine transport system permease protein